MNIAKNLEHSAFFFPERPVIRMGSSVIPYFRFNEQTNRVATALLKLGVGPGDHVGLCAPNSSEWLAIYFGAMKVGAVAVTLPGAITRDELDFLIKESVPKVIFTSEEKRDDLNEMRQSGVLIKIICPGGDLDFESLMEMGASSFRAVERGRGDTAAILFTGGTTGGPKGVTLSHENIQTAIQAVVFNERSTANDCALCFLPFNHVFGQMHIMNATILSGGCLELIPAFDMAQVLEILSKGRVTKLFAVPTIYVRLLTLENLKEKLGSVRYCFSAAASMAAEVVRQWKKRTDLDIHEAYGMTESASMVTYNHYHRHIIGSVGTAAGTTEIQIRDLEGNILEHGEEGEICIRGRNIMKGYLNRLEETKSSFWNEWFRSGDMGKIDKDGYLHIVDRLKDMIITGGENVYPKEIEEVLFTHPKVLECTVIGLPDKEWGERITAMVIPKPGQTVDDGELKDYLKTRLSAFKVPKEYRIMDQLPKSSTGKILKRVLRKDLLEQVDKKV